MVTAYVGAMSAGNQQVANLCNNQTGFDTRICLMFAGEMPT